MGGWKGLPRRLQEDFLLLLGGKRRIEGVDDQLPMGGCVIRSLVPDFAAGVLYLLFSREEDQDVPWFFAQVDLEEVGGWVRGWEEGGFD